MEKKLEFQLSEKEIKKMLGLESGEVKISPSSFGRYFLIFGLIFIISFAIINAPALYQRIRYFWFVEYQNKDLPKPKVISQDSEATLPQIAGQSSPTSLSEISDNQLIIEKIGVSAPISWNVKDNEILEKLRHGVTHLQGTALPDSQSNIFITGHSSNYWWDRGKYKQVFALLDKLVVGDEIKVVYQGKEYRYKVENVKIVKPTQVEITNPTSQPTLTLMTCTPVGTTLNRLVVSAEMVTTRGQVKSSGQSNTTPELPFLEN